MLFLQQGSLSFSHGEMLLGRLADYVRGAIRAECREAGDINESNKHDISATRDALVISWLND